MTWNWILNLAVKLLAPLVGILSEDIREMLENFVQDFYVKAKNTENGWDDFLAEVLARILGIHVG